MTHWLRSGNRPGARQGGLKTLGAGREEEQPWNSGHFGEFRRSLGGSSTSTPFELGGNLDPTLRLVKHYSPMTLS